ncbi:hypothetical protein EK21DRAFT_118465 [Setomelanomma holmii]|uniref:Argonaute linker 1 domain-containing protein n=1 Tax=Setomelanomma holmii TaxID=210430 RepID=A0A9P4GVM9_9PLEO|nr:hypothetical protein EK21DRAFT_118465 [Setomelanomma holmii]
MDGIVTAEQAEEETVPSAVRREELMSMAVRRSAILGNAGNTYDTDGMGKIVAWEPLQSPILSGSLVTNTTLEDITITVRPAHGTQPAVTHPLQLKYVGSISVRKLTEACSGNIDTLPLEPKGATGMTVVEAINIIIGHGIRNPAPGSTPQTFRLGNNKLFSTMAHNTIDLGFGMNCHKGHFLTLRHGMGRPMLNVSTAATAFYKPNQSVATFMRDFCGIDGVDKHVLTSADLSNLLRTALKGVRLRIRHENRAKATTDIANLAMIPSNVTFLDANNVQTDVAIYMATHRALGPNLVQEIASSTWPCVIFGRNNNVRHFPAETLFIVGHQPLKGKAPPDAASTMIIRAREDPLPNRQSIDSNGLTSLGLNGNPSPALASIRSSIRKSANNTL